MGGVDLGFIEEGFCSLAAYDSDRTACENFKANVAEHIEQVDLKKRDA